MEFLELSPIEIARQMTIVDYFTFRRIHLSEYLNQAWKDPKKSPNIAECVDNFNKVGLIVLFEMNFFHSQKAFHHLFFRWPIGSQAKS